MMKLLEGIRTQFGALIFLLAIRIAGPVEKVPMDYTYFRKMVVSGFLLGFMGGVVASGAILLLSLMY